MSSILGIDLSLTGTGLALITDKNVEFPASTVTVPVPRLIRQPPRTGQRLWTTRLTTTFEGFYRWRFILGHVLNWCSRADAVMIEGYSFGSHSSHTRAIAEIGGIVRYHIIEAGMVPIEVPPTMLKKFLTEKGNSDKSICLKECLRRYAFNVDDHNIVDAFTLAKIGEAMFDGTDGLPQFQVDIIEALKAGPKPKKERKK